MDEDKVYPSSVAAEIAIRVDSLEMPWTSSTGQAPGPHPAAHRRLDGRRRSKEVSLVLATVLLLSLLGCAGLAERDPRLVGSPVVVLLGDNGYILAFQWNLLLWMLVCAAAGILLWNRSFRPRLDWLWALVLVGAALLPLAPALRAHHVYGPFDTNVRLRPWATREQLEHEPQVGRLNDVTLQFAPWQAEVRRQILAGRAPLFNPFSGGGQALAANGQSAPFSLISLLALPFSPERAQVLRAFLKVLLALVGTFLAARQLGCRPAFAFVASLAYAYGGSLAVWRLFPHTEVMALWPFAFLASEQILDAGVKLRTCLLLALSCAGVLLAGHPETALAAGCALAGRWAFHLAWARGEQRQRYAIRAMLLAAFLAILSTTFFTLPLAETILSSEKLARQRGGADPPIPTAAGSALLNLWVPGIFGTPHQSAEAGPAPIQWLAEGGVGLPALLVSFCGFLLPGRRRRGEVYLMILAFIAFVLHLDPAGISSALFSLPLISLVAARYFAYLGGFAVALLAALALERWTEEPSARRRLTILVALGSAATLVTLGAHRMALNVWETHGSLARVGLDVLAESRHHATVALAAVAATLVGLALRRSPLVAGLLVALAGFAQLLGAYGGYNPTIPAAYAYPPVPLLERISREPGPFRILGTRGVFVANASTFYGLADVRTHDPTESVQYVDWLTELLDFDRAKYKKQYPRPAAGHLPFLRLLGTRFLLTGPDLHLEAPWIDHGVFRETRLWELPFAVRWAFFPRFVVPVGSAAEARAAIRGIRNPYRLASLELESSAPGRRMKNGAARVDKVLVDGDRIEISVTVDEDAWLVVSQTSIPGWRAWVDGRSARLAEADGALVAVQVPAGASEVRLRYQPRTWRIGLWLSLLAALAAQAALLVRHTSARAVGGDWRQSAFI